MLRTALFAIVILLSLGAVYEKNKFPQNFFISPLPPGTPLILAGSFGELRSNHFHAGIDFKTAGVTGMNLHAVADGYVSRIKVSSYGYGKTLYINHENGYTSVYAHLLKYNDEIEEFIKAIQIEKESWEIEIYLGKNEIIVSKGDIVAISGNSGASSAPHLHFEIRETKNQIPIDPQLFGFNIIDDICPRIYRLQVHPVGPKSMARVVYSNGRSVTKESTPISMTARGSTTSYSLLSVNEIQGFGNVAFSINANDFHNNSYNSLGVPIIEMKVNGKTYFKQEIEAIPFSKTRYLNALIDFETKLRQGIYYYRNYILPGNKLSIYPIKTNNGLIKLIPDSLYKIEFILQDRNDNKTSLKFNLRGVNSYNFSETTIGALSNKRIIIDEPSVFETDQVKIEFPANCFYEDFDFQYDDEGLSSKRYSNVHNIHNGYTPIHKFFTVHIKANIPKRYENKAVVSRWGRSEGGIYKDGWLITRSKYFGKFYIDIDTIPPAVSLFNVTEGKNMSRYSSLQLKIGDNLSGIDFYKSYLDGKFIVMEYDYKTGMINYQFEKNIIFGEHKLEVIVKDKVGNETKKEVNFIK